MRATGLKHAGDIPLPPIRATIVAGENDVGIRISDQGIVSQECFLAKAHLSQAEVSWLQSHPHPTFFLSRTFATLPEWNIHA
jgi:hypothetical protein